VNAIWVVAQNDIRKMMRSRTTYLFAIIMLAASSSYFLAYRKIISGLTDTGASAQTIHDATRTYLNTTLYIWPLLYGLVNSLQVGSVNLTLEKTGRNLEPLMVTPLSVQQIWLAKSIGLSVVGVIVGLTDVVIVFLGTTFILVIPQTGGFVMPDAIAIVTALTVIPVLVFMVVLLTTYLQMIISNPRAGNAVFGFVLVGMWIGLTVVSYYVQSTVDYYTPIYIALIAVIFMACRLASRYLTPERIVLSSKG
jgi:ABC-type Na+ efflux pump permease subunit